MASYTIRGGRQVETDEVFHAWTSGDLQRMLAALCLPTNPTDRHFLLLTIVGATYTRRKDSEMRRLCLKVGRQHLTEFRSIAPALLAELGGSLPRVPTFAQLATVLAEDDQVDEAISVCETAIALGLHDGTAGGFPGRIARLRKRKG